MADPFSYMHLPRPESPHIYDSNLRETMEDIDAGYYNDPFTPSGNLLLDQTMNDPPYPPASVKSTDDAPSNPLDTAGTPWSDSPESSSSSDGSNQHKRKFSNESSGNGDVSMADTPTVNGILIGADPVPDTVMDDEATNKFMESMLDFERAASSPILNSDMKTTLDKSQKKGITMPVRSVPVVGSANSFTSKSSGSSSSPDAGLSMIYGYDKRSQPSHPRNRFQQQPETSCAPSDLVIPDRFQFPPGYLPNPNNLAAYAHPTPIYQQPTTISPFTSSITPKKPRLYISNFAAKSRVETQHLLKYTLDPVPPGITKLHLQPYSVAKPKFMAKPTPAKSPDTYELYATVVCSSAMLDEKKREKAFARARRRHAEQEEHHPATSRGNASSKERASDDTADEDDLKPLNGGPVQICKGCVEREVRRVERKKCIDHKEQDEWVKLGNQRTVNFNVPEVREWQLPSPFAPKSNGGGKEKPDNARHYDTLPDFSPDAKQVEITTRIACYCRHVAETVGFQILVTVEDHEGNVIAQALSNSIMITDDHKTHPANNPLQDTPMVPQPQAPVFPTAFPPGQTNFQPNAPLSRNRNAHSTPDLPRVHQAYHPGLSHQWRQHAMPQETMTPAGPFTPRNLSRPSSPTILASQQTKRRKASGSTRINHDLTMTKLPNPSTAPPGSAPLNIPHPGNLYHGHAPNYLERSEYSFQPNSFQYANTNPSTPMRTTFPPQSMSNYRSHSMENLPPNGISAPSSTMSSRGASPHMANGIPRPIDRDAFSGTPYADGRSQLVGMPQHAQMLTNSLSSVNTAPTVRPTPTIDMLIPSEGSVLGGTQVSCIGSGLYEGLQVMFGDAPATETRCWNSGLFICRSPMALHPGEVAIFLKDRYDENLIFPQRVELIFRYVDGRTEDLLKMFLDVMAGPTPGSTQSGSSTKDSTMYQNMNALIKQVAARGTALPPSEGSRQENDTERRIPFSPSSISQSKTEAFLVQCLEQMDLDETLGQANLNLQGPCGQTMLHLTASLGYYRVTANLLTRGAHPDIGDNNGMSPLHMASLHGHIRTIRKLRAFGSDPTLRSLNGFTPADMTSGRDVQDAINTLDQRSRSRSAAVTPVTGLSRAPSVHSHGSSAVEYDSQRSPVAIARSGVLERYASHTIASAHMRNRSRRNSFKTQDHDAGDMTRTSLKPSASQLETQSALTAWRDQLSMQISHFQETVHRALPPLPNLPNYQYYPVVRRISSLVPQRNAPLLPSNGFSSGEKEGHYGWLELVLGPREPPPPYGDPPPQKPNEGFHDEKVSHEEQAWSDKNVSHVEKEPLMRAAVESFVDQKCEAMYDHAESSSEMETINIGSKGLTQEEQNRVRLAYAKKVKKLRKDRNFLFIWLPLFILFLLVALKDGASHVAYVTRLTRSFFQNRRDGRIIGEVM